MRRADRTAPRGTVCSLCRSESPRLGCPRCDARQLQLFAPPPDVPADAETVTLSEISEAMLRERETNAARLGRLASLGRQVRVGLIGCALAKLKVPSPARRLYASPIVDLSLAYAERSCDETYILSPGNGLIGPDEIVHPYERSLREMSKRERWAWGSRMADSITSRYPKLKLRVLLLVGQEFREPIVAGAAGRDWVFIMPFSQKPSGQRLAWLRSQLASPTPSDRGGAA